MTHDGELCASIPMTQVSLSAWYCHAHQGWCYSARIHVQDLDEVITTLHAHDGDLGPFDDPDELLDVWRRTMDEARRRIAGHTV